MSKKAKKNKPGKPKRKVKIKKKKQNKVTPVTDTKEVKPKPKPKPFDYWLAHTQKGSGVHLSLHSTRELGEKAAAEEVKKPGVTVCLMGMYVDDYKFPEVETKPKEETKKESKKKTTKAK